MITLIATAKHLLVVYTCQTYNQLTTVSQIKAHNVDSVQSNIEK